MVPLNTLLTPVMESGVAVIKRLNGFKAVQIGGGPAQGYSSGQALAAKKLLMKCCLRGLVMNGQI
jgi:multidrug efflux pump subunit AcrB